MTADIDVRSLTAVRLQLKALGYDPIPLKIDKKPYLGWPKEPNDPGSIAQWERYAVSKATGIRLYQSPGLFVLDLDIRIVAVRDAILQAYEQRWPQFMANCVRRHSQSVPLALIGRCDTNKGTLKSRRWRHEDSGEDEKDNLVEVFTQNSKRFLAVDGAHSPGRVYDYHGRPLWEVGPKELPEFSPDNLNIALELADGIMQGAGLIQKQSAILGKYILYDLKPEMRIVLDDGEALTLAELEHDLRTRAHKRTVAFPTPWDPESESARVLATLGRDGLCLWDTKTETSHRWAWHKPPESLATMAAQLRALAEITR
jgi:hypothetical protein